MADTGLEPQRPGKTLFRWKQPLNLNTAGVNLIQNGYNTQATLGNQKMFVNQPFFQI